MNQEEIDLAWSAEIANSVIEELVREALLKKVDWKQAEAIALEQIHINLASGRRPDAKFRPLPPRPTIKGVDF